MDGRKLGGIALAIGVLGIVYYTRTQDRSDVSEGTHDAVMSWVVDMPSYEGHASELEQMAGQAHTRAFDMAYDIGRVGRRGRGQAASFDDEKYVEEFFFEMIKEADRRRWSDVVEDLKVCMEDCLEMVREG